MTNTILSVDQLSKSFGGVRAVRDLSFTVVPGEILGLIGPNGSGKSTTVNVLAGLLPPTAGKILLCGDPIENLTEAERVRKGLTRTFQTARVFPEFSVRRHVTVGCHTIRRENPFRSILPIKAMSQEDKETQRHVDDILQAVLACVRRRSARREHFLGAAALPDDRYGFGFEAQDHPRG